MFDFHGPRFSLIAFAIRSADLEIAQTAKATIRLAKSDERKIRRP
jgi:hypothetical protein